MGGSKGTEPNGAYINAPNSVQNIFFVYLFIEVCSASRLEDTYLPPNGASSSVGEGSGLAAPKLDGNNGSRQPTPVYGAPNEDGDEGVSGPGDRSGKQIPIISYVNINNENGSYKWSYETENGIKAQEEGELKNVGTDNEAQSVVGSFSYTAPDGQEIKIEYTADENGFVPKGAHLPTSSLISEQTLKSLEQNVVEEAAVEAATSANGGHPTANGGDSQPSDYLSGNEERGSLGGNRGTGNGYTY